MPQITSKDLCLFDFETRSITDYPRPLSPPPAGLAIRLPGGPLTYLAWAHLQGSNGAWELGKKGKLIDVGAKYPDPKRSATLMLKDGYKIGVLGHNSDKFDCPVAEDHLGLKPPPWKKRHDTLFTLFLRDPHSNSLALKPAAEKDLGEKPEERDAVFDWLAEKGIISKPDDGVICNSVVNSHCGVHARNRNCVDPKFVKKLYPKEAAAHIAKAPGIVAARYAIGDLTRTAGLFDLHQPWIVEKGMQAAYDRERRLTEVLLDNERNGIRVDMEALERDIPIARKGLEKAEAWLRKTLSIKDKDFWYEKEKVNRFVFTSDAHIAQALKAAGVVEEFPQTAGGRDSVSKKSLRIDHYSNPKVYHALHYRNTMDSILGRMEKFFDEGSKKKGYIFREWNPVRQGHGDDNKGARSGRITVGEFANMSKAFGNKDPDYKHPAFLKVPDPPLARVYLLPDEGEEFGHCDFDQQEMKIIAHYEDGALAAQYRENPKTDIHTFVHDLIKRVTGKDYNRDVVKTLDFRKAFGSGTSGFAEQIREPQHVAQEIIDSWEAALPDVVALDRALRDLFKAGEPIRTLGGRVYHCKPPAVAKKGARKGMLVNFFYTALNYLIQPSAADQTKEALINFHHHPKRTARLLCTVYDEINISMKDRAQLKILDECMVGAFKLDVPVSTTAKVGPCWGNLKKLEDLKKEAA